MQQFVNFCRKAEIPEKLITSPLNVVNGDKNSLLDIAEILRILAKSSKIGDFEEFSKGVKVVVQPKAVQQVVVSEPVVEKQTSSPPQQQVVQSAPQKQAEQIVKSQVEQQTVINMMPKESDVLEFEEPDFKLYPTYKCSILLMGSPQVGKTTLGMRIHTGSAQFDANRVPIMFERSYLHQVDGKPANLKLEIKESEDANDVYKANFVFLCFSFDDIKSFKALPKYFRTLQKCGNPDVTLIGCKADNKTAEITHDMISKLIDKNASQDFNSFVYHSISAKKGLGIRQLLDGLEFYTSRDRK